MHRSARLRWMAATGFAAAGLVGGHALVYALVIPKGEHGHALLLNAVHGYMPLAAWAGAVVGFVALLSGIGAGYASHPDAAGLWTIARALVCAQTVAFCALEVLERVAVGAPMGDLAGPLVAVGILVQIAIAIGAALLLRGLGRVGAALAQAVEPKMRRGLRASARPIDAAPRRRRFITPIAGRAPPALRAA